MMTFTLADLAVTGAEDFHSIEFNSSSSFYELKNWPSERKFPLVISLELN